MTSLWAGTDPRIGIDKQRPLSDQRTPSLCKEWLKARELDSSSSPTYQGLHLRPPAAQHKPGHFLYTCRLSQWPPSTLKSKGGPNINSQPSSWEEKPDHRQLCSKPQCTRLGVTHRKLLNRKRRAGKPAARPRPPASPGESALAGRASLLKRCSQ